MALDLHNSGKREPVSGEQATKGAAPKNIVQEAARRFVEKLREAGYQRLSVTLLERQNDKCPPTEAVQDAAREQIKKRQEADKSPQPTSRATAGKVQRDDQPQPSSSAIAPKEASKPISQSSLPPRDSPLTKVFLGQYVSSLMQETITYREMPYLGLAHQMSIPELVLRDAVRGTLGLTRGQWVKLGRFLSLPTTFDLTPSEPSGLPCWEVCYAPISLGTGRS
jgi:hypothetical protein